MALSVDGILLGMLAQSYVLLLGGLARLLGRNLNISVVESPAGGSVGKARR